MCPPVVARTNQNHSYMRMSWTSNGLLMRSFCESRVIRMHYKRSVLALFLSIVLMVFLLSACSNNNTECKLSELKDDKLIQYITDSKIAIPEDIDIDTIRGMIIELENNLDHPAPVMGYTLVADLYEDLRNLVVEYEPSKE